MRALWNNKVSYLALLIGLFGQTKQKNLNVKYFVVIETM